MRVTALRCEYHFNPLGIDVLEPRLSWQLESSRRGARQTAYQIMVAGSARDLVEEKALLWDSDQVCSDHSIHVVYAGQPLRSAQRAWYKVRVWDEDGQVSAYSAPAWWEMGLLERAEWKGQWIGAPLAGGPRTAVPCPFLRKEFILDRPVDKARLYVTALGVYECYLNGQRVGEDIFTPGWTDYGQRVQYQVYDVGGLLNPGANAIGAILGDGWYCGNLAWDGRQHYGDRPRLLAQLVVTLDDGSTTTVVSDGSWKTAFGPLLESDMLMGESYDARREFPGWDAPGFDDARWWPIERFDDPGAALVAPPGPTVRRIQELPAIADPTEIPHRKCSKWIYDFGQNMVGYVRLKVNGPAGLTLTLRYGEVLNPDGTLYTANLRTARQTDHYTLRQGGEQVYEPHFTFHGFRYVELNDYPGQPPRDLLTGVVLHSDTPPSGTFVCSEPLLNQLQHNITWGQKGNFVDVPTDCPQRDERLGWTGDAQVFIRTAAFNMDVAAFFTKWLQDLADAQYPSGAVPPFAPNMRVFESDGGPAWSDALVICPWTIYQCYGDERMLEKHYEALDRCMAFRLGGPEGAMPWGEAGKWHDGFGDWLSIEADTPKELIHIAFLAYSAHLMSRIAAVLGKRDESERYERLYQDTRRAFVQRFVTPDGLVVSQTQTAHALALHFDLLPEHLRPVAVEALVHDIEKRDMHLSTGFVGSPYLLHVLSQAGRLDVAYELLKQETYPSWLYPVTQGATTIWERWDGWRHDEGFQDPKMNSFNHYAYGSVGAWLYAVVAGIDVDPERPGYKHVILRPRPGGDLTHARATLDSMHGRIVSDWRIKDGAFHWRVTVPPNTTATVYVPADESAQVVEGQTPAQQAAGVTAIRREPEAAVYEVESGSYHFVVTEPSKDGLIRPEEHGLAE
ncbi:MAG: glycoside hydrolase family 78 protein [Anaerolineae bacterium]|jgi:alpha-L-rhamnosidase